MLSSNPDRALQNLTAQHWFNHSNRRRARPEPVILWGLYPAEVEATVILGQATITLDDYFQLQEGDVIPLRRQNGEPMEVLVENNPVFLAQPGLKGRHRAVQITGWINEEGGLDKP